MNWIYFISGLTLGSAPFILWLAATNLMQKEADRKEKRAKTLLDGKGFPYVIPASRCLKKQDCNLIWCRMGKGKDCLAETDFYNQNTK